jgi:hypothetical protein
MSLIKIFPAFSPDLERNIQADIIGDIHRFNIFLGRAHLDVYLEIPLKNGSLYERVTTIYNEPYDLSEELTKIKHNILAVYPDRDSVINQQTEFYSKTWASMSAGELTRNRHFLVSYTKFCIIFGADYLSQDEFNKVIFNLRDKTLALKEKEQEERAAKNRIEEEKRRVAENERVEILKVRIIKDESISGEDLVDFCKSYGIDIHTRTQGTIKQKVSEVNSGSCRLQRGTIFKVSPCYYYKDLREQIIGQDEKAKQNLNHLFGKVCT